MALTKVEADGINLADTFAFTGTVTRGGNGFFGDGQTWQDMASSRAAGTYYTNSTGKPIMVFVIYTAGTNADIDLAYTPAGGSEVTGVGLYTNSSNGRVSMSFVVPNGDQYKIIGSGSETEQQWLELR